MEEAIREVLTPEVGRSPDELIRQIRQAVILGGGFIRKNLGIVAGQTVVPKGTAKYGSRSDLYIGNGDTVVF